MTPGDRMLDRERTALLVIDLQESYAGKLANEDRVDRIGALRAAPRREGARVQGHPPARRVTQPAATSGRQAPAGSYAISTRSPLAKPFSKRSRQRPISPGYFSS